MISEVVARFLITFEAQKNVLFISKVSILLLLKWQYKSINHEPTIQPIIVNKFWAQSLIFFKHVFSCLLSSSLFLEECLLTTHNLNIGVPVKIVKPIRLHFLYNCTFCVNKYPDKCRNWNLVPHPIPFRARALAIVEPWGSWTWQCWRCPQGQAVHHHNMSLD